MAISPALPMYSIVIPLYNTARYLPDLLKSLEQQHGRGSLFDLECIFVDDASPDDAGHIARDWLARRGIRGLVLEQKNSGVSVARNNGLDNVSGDWVTFIDSDDFISDGYIEGIQRLLTSLGDDAHRVSLVSCNVVRYFEADDRYDFAHPLRDKFNGGDRIYDLEQHAEFIQSQAASAFFNVQKLRTSGIRFLEGLHAAEDALFVSSFLITQTPPVIACVQTSDYFYRQRAAGDSAQDRFNQNPDFYFARFTRGYLPLFERATDVLGEVPRWLGQYFLYDMRWLFPREEVEHRKATHLTGHQKSEVLRLVAETLEYIHPEWIRDYSITGFSIEHRNLMLALKGHGLLTDGHVQAFSIDRHRDLVQLRYYFTGELPSEALTVGGHPADVVASKTRRLDYLGQNFLRQRIFWLVADDDLVVVLDGEQQKIHTTDFPAPQYSATRARMGFDAYVDPMALPTPDKIDRPLPRRIVGRALREAAAAVPAVFTTTPYYRSGMDLRIPRVVKALQVHAQRPGVRRRFRDAWLFEDRPDSLGASVEALYRHVREHRSDINAFIVLDKGSGNWHRLKRAGARLLPRGSVDHKSALMYARFRITSYLSDSNVEPMPQQYYWGEQAPWRLIYLQDPTTLQSDRSILMNRAGIDLVATSSVADLHAMTADGTSYVLTSLQVRLTGSPRHDALVREARVGIDRAVRTVLFAPQPTPCDAEDAMLVREAWLALVNSAEMRQLAEHYNLRIKLLSPSLDKRLIPAESIPEHVEQLDSDSDLPRLLASTDLVITDSLSLAMDAAVAYVRTTYLQHADEHVAGSDGARERRHARSGEYQLGVTATSVQDVVAALARQLDPTYSQEFVSYRSRVSQSFPNLDGAASARVLEEIINLDRVP